MHCIRVDTPELATQELTFRPACTRMCEPLFDAHRVGPSAFATTLPASYLADPRRPVALVAR